MSQPEINLFLQVRLPTGTKVTFEKGRLTVRPSVFDYDQTEGLCGNFNENILDDKIQRGSEVPDTGRPSVDFPGYDQYHDFQESWRYDERDISIAMHDYISYIKL